MAVPTTKQFEKALDKLMELTKQRVRIGRITYGTKKDVEDFDRRNWKEEAEEELADAIAYMNFAYIQLCGIFTLLRHMERRLEERVRELRKLESTETV